MNHFATDVELAFLAGSFDVNCWVKLDASKDGIDLICNIDNAENGLKMDSLLDSVLNELRGLTTTNVPEAHNCFLVFLYHILLDFFVVESDSRHHLLTCWKTTRDPSLVEKVCFSCAFWPNN